MTDQKKAAAEAAAQAAAFSASATYERGWEDGRAEADRLDAKCGVLSMQLDEAHARADNAERMVVEARMALERAEDVHANECPHQTNPGKPYTCECDAMGPVRAALASSADVAGRWVPVEEHASVMESVINIMALLGITEENAPPKEKPSQTVGRAIDTLRAERDAAIAARDEAVARLEEVRAEQRFSWEVGAAAERARDEVGIQLAAAQAEIARMRPVVDAVRTLRRDLDTVGMSEAPWREALDALDTVPGDALAPCLCGELAGRCPRHDALATDTKGVE